MEAGAFKVYDVSDSVSDGDHHNPMSIHWELERNLLQTSVNTHRKVDVEQSGSGVLGLGWNLGGAA